MAIRSHTNMSLDHFNDFYYLIALKSEIQRKISEKPVLQFNHAVEKLQVDLEKVSDIIIPSIAYRTFVYLYAACMGEARHAVYGVTDKYFIPQLRNMNRSDVFSNVLNFPPTKENLDTLVKAYEQEWKGSYGGRAWLRIAQATRDYYNVSNEAFIDHVIDLEHNCGTVFSKSESQYSLKFKVRYNGNFKQFLDYKFRHNILTDSFFPHLNVSRKVYSLIQRYDIIFGVKEQGWIRPTLQSLDEYEIDWGDNKISLEEKWTKWISVHKSNIPDARTLLAISELNNINPLACTTRQFEAHIKSVKKTIKKAAGKYWKQVKDACLKTIESYYNNGIKNCKVPKAKVTYDILPCKIRAGNGEINLKFSFPFQNVGTKTEYGFEFRQAYEGHTFGNTEKNYIDDGYLYQDGYVSMRWGSVFVVWGGGGQAILGKSNLEALLND